MKFIICFLMVFVCALVFSTIPIAAQPSDGNIWDIWGWEENFSGELITPQYGDQMWGGWYRGGDDLLHRRCPICGCDNAVKGSDGTSGIVCCCFFQIDFMGLRWMVALIPLGVR